MILVYRRYVVGWLVAERESAILADHLITETCRKQDITPEKLTLTCRPRQRHHLQEGRPATRRSRQETK
jgi:hypothetical protein